VRSAKEFERTTEKSMYAVVTSGGKQYRVEAGTEFIVERFAAESGASVTFDRVLLIGDGDDVTIGAPTIAGASVSATVLGEELGPKLIIFKFKQKVKYRRRTGHRQHLVRVRVDGINASGTSRGAAKATEAQATDSEAAAKAAPKKSRAKTAAAAKAPAKKATAKKTPATAKPSRARAATPGPAAAKTDDTTKAEAPPKRARASTARKKAKPAEE